MSLPTSEPLFAQARAAESWVEYPLIERGDSTAKIYHMRCSINRSDYSPLALNTTMSSATAAGVKVLPFSSDSTALFIADHGHRYLAGDLVEFDRQFATLPNTRTAELVGSRSFAFPSTQKVVYTVPDTVEAAEFDENLWKYEPLSDGNPAPAPLYLTSTYYRSAQLPSSLPKVFTSTKNGLAVDYVANEYRLIKQNGKAADGETFNCNFIINRTVPSADEYTAMITNGGLLTVDVSIERYAGDIYVLKKYQMRAQ